MVSHRQVIKKLTKVLEKIDPNKKINWEMATFRHNYFKVIDSFKQINGCAWSVDTKLEVIILKLIFPNKMISCSYDYKKRTVDIFDEGNFVEQVEVENLFETFQKLFPKKKIIVKVKR